MADDVFSVSEEHEEMTATIVFLDLARFSSPTGELGSGGVGKNCS